MRTNVRSRSIRARRAARILPSENTSLVFLDPAPPGGRQPAAKDGGAGGRAGAGPGLLDALHVRVASALTLWSTSSEQLSDQTPSI